MNKNLAESLNNILDIIESSCTDAGGDVHVNPGNLSPFKEETDYLKERLVTLQNKEIQEEKHARILSRKGKEQDKKADPQNIQ